MNHKVAIISARYRRWFWADCRCHRTAWVSRATCTIAAAVSGSCDRPISTWTAARRSCPSATSASGWETRPDRGSTRPSSRRCSRRFVDARTCTMTDRKSPSSYGYRLFGVPLYLFPLVRFKPRFYNRREPQETANTHPEDREGTVLAAVKT